MSESELARGRLVLLHSDDPAALFAHAAAPFCVEGRSGRLPLLVVRQGGIRDELHERAAKAGCTGWLGAPVVVFGELPGLLAGDLAPLSPLERRMLLQGVLDRTPLDRLRGARRQRGFIDAIDGFFGDLMAERIDPDDVSSRLTSARHDDWEGARNGELTAIYRAYRQALAALPALHGLARTDGRDGLALAADAIRDDADGVRGRLRRPFATSNEPLTIALYGLNDLRRGWDRLLDTLRAAPFVAELRVYLPLGDVGDADSVDRRAMESIGDHALLDALMAKVPNEVVRVPSTAGDDALAAIRRTIFRTTSAPEVATITEHVRAIAAPDMARELEAVARRVKQLIVDDNVAPHTIAVVSRKSRPYGPRAAEQLRRHGVPVSARLRTNLAEVSAVAALLRVFRSAAEGFSWRALAELGESPYFTLDLDIGLLKRASARGRLRSLDAWSAALRAMSMEAEYERGSDDYRGPDAARVTGAVELFERFRAIAVEFTRARTRDEWLALALRSLGQNGDGGLWGFRRNACCPPNDESDALLVESTRRDIEALDCLTSVLAEWRGALSLCDGAVEETLSVAAFERELADAIDGVEVTLSSPNRRGVQVLEASAAVWRTFDHLFVVGMSVGDFPAEPSGRELFAEHEREELYEAARLPLEPARVWFAREASLLRTLLGGARRSLHASYSYADANGATQIASAYFDEIVSRCSSGNGAEAFIETLPGSRIAPPTLADAWCSGDLELYAAHNWSSGDAERRRGSETAYAQLAVDDRRRALIERMLAAARVEHDRRAFNSLRASSSVDRAAYVKRWNGEITSRALLDALATRFGDTVWSASQLESYGRCPFTFFGKYVLGLRDFEEPDEEMDGATRGSLVHVCLDRLYSGLAADLGDDAMTTRALPRASKLIPAIVTRALDEFDKTGRGGPAPLRGYRERELAALLQGYLEWEIAENEKEQRRTTPRRTPRLFELRFGMNGRPPASITRHGRVLMLRGMIDRIDEITDDAARGWRYVVDHKTGDSTLSPLDLYDEGAVLQLPLYLHALDALGESGAGMWGGAYQIVKDECRRAAPLHPRTLIKGRIREGSNQTEQKAASRVHDAVDLALGHVDAVIRGEFPARIPECTKHCLPFCDMRDVCREDQPARGGPRR